MVLLTMGPFAILLGAASLVLVAAYPFMKRITWWPQAWLGLTFNWGALLGYAAATGRLGWPPVLLYAAGVFWTLGYDTIYAVQDLEDDALAGVKSSARRLGKAAPTGVMVFYLVSIVLVFAAGALAHLGPLFALIAALYAAHLVSQPLRLRIDDPQRALQLFNSNRDAALILFAALIAGLWRAPVPWFGF
jgi:4-hydroxybenzoate polyprenyltransferase